VGGEGGLVLAHEASVVVDPPVGAFDDPPAGLDDRPVVSTRMWRLMPSIFLAPSKPRGPATDMALTEEESTIAAVGFGFLPARVRVSSRSTRSRRDHRPVFVHLVKCLWAADQVTVKSCGRARQGVPVRAM